MFLHVDSEDTDQAGWMPRLIWIFAGRTGHFVGFVMRQLICCQQIELHATDYCKSLMPGYKVWIENYVSRVAVFNTYFEWRNLIFSPDNL